MPNTRNFQNDQENTLKMKQIIQRELSFQFESNKILVDVTYSIEIVEGMKDILYKNFILSRNSYKVLE